MEMVQVESSNIAAVGYDAEKQELHVTFKNGGTYAYKNVPPAIHEQMMASPSKGSYIAKVLKPGYDCAKLEPEKKEEK